MHEHDLDLIAAYADGSGDVDVIRAQRLVDSCPICRREYEVQAGVRQWLADAKFQGLDGTERSRIRSAVLSQVQDRSTTRLRAWLAAGSVAAALLVVVGLGGILSNGFSAGDSAEVATMAADDGSSTTAAVLESDTAEPQMGIAEAAVAAEDLGQTDMESLRRIVDDRIASAEALSTEESASRALPPDLLCLDTVEGTPIESVTATVDGTALEVYIVEVDGDFEARYLRSQDCSPLLP